MTVKQLLQKVVRKLDSLTQSVGECVSPLLSSVDRAGLFSSERLLRLGTAYGGWIIPVDNGLTAGSLCYCAGAGEDISFECALVEQFGCRVRVIDPTPRAIQHFHDLAQAVRSGVKFPVNSSTVDFYSIAASHLDRLEFLPVGLADKDTDMKFFLPQNPTHVSCSVVNLQKTAQYFTAPCLRLSSIMNRQRDGSIDLLKIDIEGAEYGVIEDMVASGLLPRLLLIEFDEAHTPLDGKAPERISRHIALLAHSGMRCIAVEGSNATFMKAS
nr:FkbM family methyltransferase [Nitrosomonas nitrosa]